MTPIKITWSRPHRFQRDLGFQRDDDVGTYVIFSESHHWRYGRDRANSIIYIGSGNITDRWSKHITGHADGNATVYEHLYEPGAVVSGVFTLLPEAAAACWEAELLEAFRAVYGRYPPGNAIAGSCPVNSRAYAFVEASPIIRAHHVAL